TFAGAARRCVRRASNFWALPSALARRGRPSLARALLEVTKGGVFWMVAVGPARCAMRTFLSNGWAVIDRLLGRRECMFSRYACRRLHTMELTVKALIIA